MNDEEEELALLRRQRKQALGDVAGATRVRSRLCSPCLDLRRRFRCFTYARVPIKTVSSMQGELSRRIGAAQDNAYDGQAAVVAGHLDEDTSEDEEAEVEGDLLESEDIDPALRQHFPMSFGMLCPLGMSVTYPTMG